jgi:hypothetical protein
MNKLSSKLVLASTVVDSFYDCTSYLGVGVAVSVKAQIINPSQHGVNIFRASKGQRVANASAPRFIRYHIVFHDIWTVLNRYFPFSYVPGRRAHLLSKRFPRTCAYDCSWSIFSSLRTLLLAYPWAAILPYYTVFKDLLLRT